MFANEATLGDLQNNNKSEYVKISKIIFECFDSFSKKCEKLKKIKVDQWAQIQRGDGHNAITNLLCWTAQVYCTDKSLNVRFPMVTNCVFS